MCTKKGFPPLLFMHHKLVLYNVGTGFKGSRIRVIKIEEGKKLNRARRLRSIFDLFELLKLFELFY